MADGTLEEDDPLTHGDLARTTYDEIAGQYDQVWSRFVEGPERQLTADLELRPGERVADCGCGTGIHTVAMLERVAPGEVVAVDCSEAMLGMAKARAEASGLCLTTAQSDMAEFVDSAASDGFDALSIRFGLAYLDWPRYLPRVGRLLRSGGRVGVLTSLASSAPQAYGVYLRMTEQFRVRPVVPSVPAELSELERTLELGRLRVRRSWVHRFRLWFGSGYEAANWLRRSGYVTHPELAKFAPGLLEQLVRTFARRLESEFGGARGVPMDFDVAGVVAARESDESNPAQLG